MKVLIRVANKFEGERVLSTKEIHNVRNIRGYDAFNKILFIETSCTSNSNGLKVCKMVVNDTDILDII